MEGIPDGGMARVKQEPESVTDRVIVKEEAEFADEECVKEECEGGIDKCGVSEAAMLAGLYADHEVKDEVVLGPERPHRPDVALVVRTPAVVSSAMASSGGLGSCSVRLERLLPAAARRGGRGARRADTPAPAHNEQVGFEETYTHSLNDKTVE
ncbi:uncharacterized protein LOC133534323 [Cydia pomonella]|uniref:uncharacterized protein LOC133534323 n=1 Tax=Cydia pomonella TaxID=82600 RepID=UPI002ADD58D4|nr:uncharacterized protein LOC133534323 [Cydia pomonella]